MTNEEKAKQVIFQIRTKGLSKILDELCPKCRENAEKIIEKYFCDNGELKNLIFEILQKGE